jgi:hypothetical protein
MTNSMSKQIPKKQKQGKTFAKAVIPLWPRATWVPEKENADGEKARSLKVELSTEPGNLNGKDYVKSFKIYRSGTPKEWILWRQDFNEVCVGMSISTGPAYHRMIRQLLSDKPLKEFERLLGIMATEIIGNCNLALDAVTATIFPTNAYAKQKSTFVKECGNPRTSPSEGFTLGYVNSTNS